MITRLTLANGDWVDVKDRQTVGDESDVHGYANEGHLPEGAGFKYNIAKHRSGTAAVRIKNWSVTSLDDQKPIRWPGPGSAFLERVKVFRGLYQEQGDEIVAAIEAHLTALSEAKAEAKKETQDGATDSAQSSPSAS